MLFWPRTQILNSSHATLVSAEKGDFGNDILRVRRAGADYVKSYLKDLTHGQKNPVRRLKKHLKDSEDIATWSAELRAKASAALTSFTDLEEDFNTTGSDDWTAHNAQTKINELFMKASHLQSSHTAITAALQDIENERTSIRKVKQAKARANRIDVKRILQVFEDHKLPEAFRMFIKDNGLAIDLAKFSEAGNSVPNPYEFKDYKPSQDAHVEVSENSMKSWEHPKWWTETDEGAHIMLLHSKTMVYCTCMC